MERERNIERWRERKNRYELRLKSLLINSDYLSLNFFLISDWRNCSLDREIMFLDREIMFFDKHYYRHAVISYLSVNFDMDRKIGHMRCMR